jgi:hypothetical protein
VNDPSTETLQLLNDVVKRIGDETGAVVELFVVKRSGDEVDVIFRLSEQEEPYGQEAVSTYASGDLDD